MARQPLAPEIRHRQQPDVEATARRTRHADGVQRRRRLQRHVDDEPLQIADVVPQANLTVNEHGTVASAATAVIVRAASAPSHIEQMVVDRPFLYAIVDQPTGAILFAGQVTDPTTTA